MSTMARRIVEEFNLRFTTLFFPFLFPKALSKKILKNFIVSSYYYINKDSGERFKKHR